MPPGTRWLLIVTALMTSVSVSPYAARWFGSTITSYADGRLAVGLVGDAAGDALVVDRDGVDDVGERLTIRREVVRVDHHLVRRRSSRGWARRRCRRGRAGC